MSNTEQKFKSATEVVQAAIDALNEGDAEGFIGSFSDDLHFRMPGTTPVSTETKGLPEFIKVVTGVADYLDVLITIRVTNFISCGDWVLPRLPVTESPRRAKTTTTTIAICGM